MHLGNLARVRAVSVSVPRLVEIHGRPISTSIVHDPHPGPLAFEAGGPAGNSTAVHTEDVLAMPAEHYDYWARELGVERSAWGDCHFGREPDALRPERAFAAEVIGVHRPHGLVRGDLSGIPCFKLSWRLGQPASSSVWSIPDSRDFTCGFCAPRGRARRCGDVHAYKRAQYRRGRPVPAALG